MIWKVKIALLWFLFSSSFCFAAGPILNSVEQVPSASHFRVVYKFSNAVDLKNVSTELINSTIQVNVAGAELEQDKRFDKLRDPMVNNLYSFMPDRDVLALRINYKSKYNSDHFEGRVATQIDGKNLIVTIADGRAIELGTLDKILEKPSNLNAQKIEDKYRYLQKRLTDEDMEVEEAVQIEMPKVISVDNFDKELAGQLKYDNSDSVKEIPVQKEEGIIKVKRVHGQRETASEKTEVLLEEKVESSSEESTEASHKKNESDIPVFTKNTTEKNLKGESSSSGMTYTLIVLAGIALVSVMAIRRYAKTKLKENKHTSIKVLTQHHLGPKKSLAIIRVAGESILIGVTDNNINLIKSLSLLDEDIPEEKAQNNFEASLREQDRAQEQRIGMDLDIYEEEEEFSVRGLKDMVRGKLSGLKEL